MASSLSPSIQDPTLKQNLPEQYLLFVGNRALYKNFQSYLRAISSLFRKYNNLHLICAGGGSFNKEELTLIATLRLQNRIRQVAINDEKLSTLYRHATAFVFPSLYEGFGIPVVEAFSCGCPALLSNTSSLPEVGGKAALYFDPTSAEEMIHATEQILENTELRNIYAQKGVARATNFQWQTTAECTGNLYHAIV
nr:glycosyltransferase family 1 protein [Pontibacter ruber]